MKVQILQHVPFEGPGSMAAWLAARRADVACTRLFAGDPLPRAEQVDALIALGGPMSVNDEDELEWLRPEKQLVRDAVARGLPVLGVCLGAQLIASALGARVYPGAAREIGWFPIRGLPDLAPGFQFPPECLAFHWHGETFDLPAGAVRLASSAGCENQAFQWSETSSPCSFTSKRRLPASRRWWSTAGMSWCRGPACTRRANCATRPRRATRPSTG